MDLHEFELRHLAYSGLNEKFSLGWNQDTLIDLVRISDKGIIKEKIQNLTPKQLQKHTYETYTKFKKDFIEKNKKQIITPKSDINTKDHSLSDYISRLEYELKVIKSMGFNSYFLIVSDFILRSKKNIIAVGPGRGSGAGSLLAWVTKITDIDPLIYGLLFERFLNPARITMPDFDIDFEDTQRDKVIEYVTNKYGKEKVCAIGTYMKMATKAAFKDSARTVGLNFERSNQVSNLIPEKSSILEAINSKDGNEELKAIYESDSKVKQATQYATKLEGNLRQLGVHACGIIISPEKITTYTPIQYIKDDSTLGKVSQYDGPTLEKIGLLKMDFLGLRNLSVIKNCIKIITKRYQKIGKELPEILKNFNKESTFHPPLNDKKTYETIFASGNTTGIFQFESEGMRRFLIQLKANSINDLVAMNALYRPGPMEFIPKYIDRKHGKEKVTYMQQELKNILLEKYNEETVIEEEKKLTEDLDPIMNLTYGIAVYQEQLMFLVQSMAGFSLAEADILRRGVGKKKIEVIEKLKKEFIKRGESFRKYKPETSKFIYEKMIEPAASYSFNKSHSVCYSYIAYQTAYLKTYFPVEFYASLIRSVEEDIDEVSNYIYEAQLQGIEVLPPNVNESFNHVAAINDKIRLGYLCIKGIGFEVGEFIQNEWQKNGNFKSLEDFLKRCEKIINKKSLESLIKSGSLDIFEDRNTMLKNFEYLQERTKGSQNMNAGLFGSDESITQISFPKKYKTQMLEKLQQEQEVFKAFVSGNPLDGLYNYIKKYSFISQFKNTENAGKFIIIGFIRNIQRAKKKGFFIQIEDISGHTEFFLKDLLDFKKFDILIIHGYKGKNASITKIIKTNREKLKKLSGKSYDNKLTVTKVKKMRLGDDIKNLYSQKTENPNIPSDTSKGHNNPIPKEKSHKNQNNKKFAIPEKINLIKQISEIIKSNPGSQKIIIGEKEVSISSEGLKKLIYLYDNNKGQKKK